MIWCHQGVVHYHALWHVIMIQYLCVRKHFGECLYSYGGTSSYGLRHDTEAGATPLIIDTLILIVVSLIPQVILLVL